jgi:hypothetical protein
MVQRVINGRLVMVPASMQQPVQQQVYGHRPAAPVFAPRPAVPLYGHRPATTFAPVRPVQPAYEPPQTHVSSAVGAYPSTQWVKVTDTTGKSWKFSNPSLGQSAIAQLRARGQLGQVIASRPPDPQWARAANPTRV